MKEHLKFKHITILLLLCTTVFGQETTSNTISQLTTQKQIMEVEKTKDPQLLEVASGDFQATWASLSQRKFPKWFENAKFGIWAHWGPQSAPEYGDWYARNMYTQGNAAYNFHLKKYGHPSSFGFKDIIPTWTADKFDADKLTELYKKAGARYIVTMANHHDNFDNWDSKYQPWNSVNMGPKRDIVGLWKKAATKNGLRFGVSVHNINVWGWYDTARGADSLGTKAGQKYDGQKTIADGKGKWWEGYDPADLYSPMHKIGPNGDQPTQEFMENWFLRTKDLIDTYKPDLIAFDLWVPSNIWRQWVKFEDVNDHKIDQRAGMLIAQHYFNQERKWNKGADEGIFTLKGLPNDKLQAATLSLERDYSKEILPMPYQLEESMGDWHYQGEGRTYLSTAKVIAMLSETVSRNGNLLLNIVMRPDGTIAGDQEKTLLEVGEWLKTNGEAIYGSKPFKVMGEGPNRMKCRAELKEEHLPNILPNYTQEDIRFTTNNDAIYAIVLTAPTHEVIINSIRAIKIREIKQLGSSNKLVWKQTAEKIIIQPEKMSTDNKLPVVFQIKY